jgi:hypothetical protein
MRHDCALMKTMESTSNNARTSFARLIDTVLQQLPQHNSGHSGDQVSNEAGSSSRGHKGFILGSLTAYVQACHMTRIDFQVYIFNSQSLNPHRFLRSAHRQITATFAIPSATVDPHSRPKDVCVSSYTVRYKSVLPINHITHFVVIKDKRTSK